MQTYKVHTVHADPSSESGISTSPSVRDTPVQGISPSAAAASHNASAGGR